MRNVRVTYYPNKLGMVWTKVYDDVDEVSEALLRAHQESKPWVKMNGYAYTVGVEYLDGH